MEKNTAQVTFGFSSGAVWLLEIIFVALKCFGVINWSWLWVLSPLWISLGLSIIIFVIVIIIISIYTAMVSKIIGKWM
jgi:membrane protein YdbS with pleckstrin-like domain